MIGMTVYYSAKNTAETARCHHSFGKQKLENGVASFGSGVIWNGIYFERTVIPAKAGIQSVDSLSPRTCGVDSRFRGDDCDLRRPCLANDTRTPVSSFLTCFARVPRIEGLHR